MKRDEWRAARLNEAANVPDTQWATETRRSLWWWEMTFSALYFAALAAIQVLCFAVQPPTQLWLGVMLVVVGLGLSLGFGGRSPFTVGAASLVYFPAAWLTVVLWQALSWGQVPMSPGVDDAGFFVLPVLAASAALVGGFLRVAAKWGKRF